MTSGHKVLLVVAMLAAVVGLALWRASKINGQSEKSTVRNIAKANAGAATEPDEPMRMESSTGQEPVVQAAEDREGSKEGLPFVKDTKGGLKEQNTTPAPIKEVIGRDSNDLRDKLLSAKTWDDFYELIRKERVKDDRLEELIIDRLGVELSLSQEGTKALRSMFLNEQTKVTEAAVTKFGSGKALDEGASAGGKEFWSQLREVRDGVRTVESYTYLQYFTHEQMARINEHLRNEAIKIGVTYRNNEVRYVVRGVGK